MELESQVPAVCSALRSQMLRDLAGVGLIEESGPEESTTAAFTYRLAA